MAAVLLMLLGTQWYLLFNIIAGATAIPQDLKDAATMLQLDRLTRWRTLILPSIFPYIITGAITSAGGAWNASIIAEYIQFRGKTFSINGLGALISEATPNGDYPLLLAATPVSYTHLAFSFSSMIRSKSFPIFLPFRRTLAFNTSLKKRMLSGFLLFDSSFIHLPPAYITIV